MWAGFLIISVCCPFLAAILFFVLDRDERKKTARRGLFHFLFGGMIASVVIMFLPVHGATAETSLLGAWRTLSLSVFNTMQVFAIGCDFDTIIEKIVHCPAGLDAWYQAWAATLFVVSPVFSFGFVLLLFKNLSAGIRYICAYFSPAYVFSDLNEKTLALAGDISKKHPEAAIVFCDVFAGEEESDYELLGSAKKMGAICFKKNILMVDFKKHAESKPIFFFTLGNDETENLNQALKLIEVYKNRKDTHIYVFSKNIDSEILLTSVDKGEVKVRRINEVQSLINRVLFENGNILFDTARSTGDGMKKISAVVVGMGHHGTEMVKALSWFCQMDGYRLEINAFDMDVLAEEKFVALAPELMSPDYNGVYVEGEAQYKITIHSGIDSRTARFAGEIAKLTDATYVVVALGDDDVNIETAINLRMYFERMKIKPVIQVIVYNSQQRKALSGITNFKGQSYDIEIIGDMEASYAEDVIIDSDLEEEALRRHLKHGKEEDFWTYEYNYRSSVASAIHMKARIEQGIPGAAKKEDDLTDEERKTIESLEHRRWNAYMRAEGYVYSGSTDKSSRNDLAKMHPDLVDYASLPESEKRLDSKVGTN